MRAVLWAAVSSKPQLEGDSIETQLADARRFASDAGLHVVNELTVPGHSRDYIFFPDAARDMDAYATLHILCQRKAFDVLVCRARDRLGRTDALCAQVEALVSQAGAQVYSLSMPTPLGNAASEGDLYVAAFERARAQADVQRLVKYRHMGMGARARSGRPLVQVPYGYRRIGRGREARAEVVPERAAVVRQIVAWYLAGRGVKWIAAQLDERGIAPPQSSRHWQQTTIYNIVTCPFYAGFTYYNRQKETGVMARGLHEPLFDEATWARLQAEAARRRSLHAGGISGDRPFSGVVRCRRCGMAMVAAGVRHDGHPASPHYRCNTHAKSKRECHYNHVTDRRIRDAFARFQVDLRDGLEETLAGMLAQKPDSARRLAEIAQEAESLRREGERLVAAYVRGVALSLEEFEAQKVRLDARLLALVQEESALRRQSAPDAAALRADLEALAALDIDHADPAQTRALLARRIVIWCEERAVQAVVLLEYIS